MEVLLKPLYTAYLKHSPHTFLKSCCDKRFVRGQSLLEKNERRGSVRSVRMRSVSVRSVRDEGVRDEEGECEECEG